MRAALIHGPADIRVVDRPKPAPAEDEALIRVMAYAPYGTDIGHYLSRSERYRQEYPFGVGADFSGIVEAIGARVANVRVGDRVSALALNHCGHCPTCRAGKTNLCTDAGATSRPRQSCCQQYTTVAANKLAVVPPTVSFEEAAMLAGAVVALNAFEIMGLEAGGRLAVIGVGAMGQSAIATAHACGIEAVAIGGTGGRVALAARLGAQTVLPLARHGEMVTERALELFPGGFSHVLETTASEWGLSQAIAIAAPQGKIGITGGGPLPGTAWDIVLRELRLMGVSAGHHQEQALALIAAGQLDLKPAITGRYGLEDTPEAFALLAGPAAADSGRVLILMDG